MKESFAGYLWGFKKWQAADKSFEKFRQFYPDCDLFCQLDFEGDIENYSKVCDKWNVNMSINEFQVGYCGNFGSSNYEIGRDHWPKQNAFQWLDNIYYACSKTAAKYLIMLEEDVFIMKPLSILKEDFGAAVVKNNNYMPYSILSFIHSVGGNTNTVKYGCCGGCIINTRNLIDGWEVCREKLWNDFDSITMETKLIGWSDCLLQVVIQCGGGEVIVNPQLVEPWMVDEGWIQDDWRGYELVNYLKDPIEINKL